MFFIQSAVINFRTIVMLAMTTYIDTKSLASPVQVTMLSSGTLRCHNCLFINYITTEANQDF